VHEGVIHAMDSNTHDVLVAFAPYISVIIGGLVSWFSFLESKRKTKHDELSDLYDKIATDNERLRKENESLRKERDKDED